MRLIDADAYAAEMKKRQDACKERIENPTGNVFTDGEHWGGVLAAFVEAKLTLDAAPTVKPGMDEFTRAARMIREARPLVFKGTVGYDFCVCENCRQKVDAHDVYCRQCGRVLVKGVDEAHDG